jgi:uncharacterized protein (DUF1015 family)
MDKLIKPFRALRPQTATAAAVIAPPYDVVDTDEARALAADRPDSFLRISRPEIEFADGTDAHDDAVYARGKRNLDRLRQEGTLIRDAQPSLYAYRMKMGSHEQTGLALTASVRAYEQNRVRKHELTKPVKENDRVRNIEALNAQTGPVLSAFHGNPHIAGLLGRATQGAPLFAVEGPHAVVHSLWQIDDAGRVGEFVAAFEALGVLYIADGHHRSAAAARVAAARRVSPTGDTGNDAHEYFLSVAFPHDELKILDYNRTLCELNGHSAESLRNAIAQSFTIEALPQACKPAKRGEFAMYLDGGWYRLSLDPSARPADPVAGLDVSVLQQKIIEPLLGVADPRNDARIDFVGGIRGLGELQGRVDSGRDAVAFALYPTSMVELIAVADAEMLMPPKSTWFEPKLADGLLSHLLG